VYSNSSNNKALFVSLPQLVYNILNLGPNRHYLVKWRCVEIFSSIKVRSFFNCRERLLRFVPTDSLLENKFKFFDIPKAFKVANVNLNCLL
jgi:hypothetical protein